MLVSPSTRTATYPDPTIASNSKSSMQPDNQPQASDLQKQFEAAVRVIRGLPDTPAKDAPFQPSDELKLRFYAFYKQATEGPNRTTKPAFYDLVGRYKWQAWSSLGNMSREEAMRGYVNELKKIVEAMSLTQPVSEFYDVLGPFYEFVSPDRQPAKANGSAIMPASRVSSGPKVNGLVNGDAFETESEGEEFSDTYDHISEDNSVISAADRAVNPNQSDEIITARGEAELTPPRPLGSAAGSRTSSRAQVPRGGQRSRASASGFEEYGAASGASGDGYDKPGRRDVVPEVNEQIAIAILRLQQSMEQVENRLYMLENQIRNSNAARDSRNIRNNAAVRSWWPFVGLSPTATLFFLMWPVATHLLIERIRNQRSGK